MNIESVNQTSEQKLIQDELGLSTWITVFEYSETEDNTVVYWTSLAPSHFADSKILSNYTWDTSIGDNQYSLIEHNGKLTYSNRLESGWEFLVLRRTFPIDIPAFVEVCEEFRALFNLAPKENSCSLYYIEENGDLDEVVRIEANAVKIKRNYLTHYLKIKNMKLVIFFEFDKHIAFDSTLNNVPTKQTYRDDTTHYNLHFSTWGWKKGKNLLSRIMGKKIIYPAKKVTLNLWHLGIKPEEYFQEFIIGEDEDGRAIKFSCNPDLLADYFGKNEHSPHYLTQVFFKKDVLDRYYSNTNKFVVSDSRLSCSGLWLLRMDNHHLDYVSAYLGDLGRDLPEQERAHWLVYNIKPEDRALSETKFKRDFLGVWASSEYVDHKFKQEFEAFQKKWEEKFGWKFFKKLHVKDQHHYDTLRTPHNSNQDLFDEQVLALTRVLIESMNEKEVSKLVTDKNLLKDKNGYDLKGIGKLEAFFRSQKISEYEPHISFLRDLQSMRSISSAHRKSENTFEKDFSKLNMDSLSLSELFQNYLNKAISFLGFLDEKFLQQ